MTSIVLAGGTGRRLGRNKLLQTLGERTLLQRTIDRLARVSNEILVVVGQGQPAPAVSSTSVEVVVDLYPNKGALGGIYTGLTASCSFHSLVVAGDMPFLNTSLLLYMVESAPAFDVVMPRVDDGLEPLHAVYSKNCLAPMQRQIEQGELRIRRILDQVRVKYVAGSEIGRFDPQGLSFFNVNTVDDLRRAKAILNDVGNLES